MSNLSRNRQPYRERKYYGILQAKIYGILQAKFKTPELNDTLMKFSVACFGVRVSVMFHLMFVHYTFSSVRIAEWPPLGK